MSNNIFIQARMGSSRLPGKVLKKICSKSILELIYERLKNVSPVEKIILVTGPLELNKPLIEEAKKLNLDYFCGNEENILDRFYKASEKFPSDNIVRVLADCPLVDFNIINRGLKIFENNNYDILSIARKRTFPHGLDFELFKKSALVTLWKDKLEERGSLEIFSKTFMNLIQMLEDKKFINYDLINEENLSNIRLTVDFLEDFELVSKIYEILYDKNKKFTLKEILELLKQRPKLLDINKKHVIY